MCVLTKFTEHAKKPLTAALSGNFGKELLVSICAHVPRDLPVAAEGGMDQLLRQSVTSQLSSSHLSMTEFHRNSNVISNCQATINKKLMELMKALPICSPGRDVHLFDYQLCT